MNGTIESLECRRLLAVTGLPVQLGSDNFDAATRVVETADGGYVVAGIFSETLNLNSASLGNFSITANGDTDLFVAKYNSASQLVWIKQFGGDAFEDDIRDQDEFIDIDGLPTRAGGPFINGVGPQPRRAGEFINDLAVDEDGSIVMAGAFAGTVDFNPGRGKKIFKSPRSDFYDGFVLKLNSGGGFLWATQISEQFTEVASGIAIDSTGAVFVTGLFSRTIDFIPGDKSSRVVANGRADVFLMKLRPSSGTIQWVNTFGKDAVDTPDRDAGLDVAVDSADNVYVVGTFVGSPDFDPSPTATAIVKTKGATDGFLAKYSPTGRFRSVSTMGSDKYDGLTNVVIDSDDSVIVTGYFEGRNTDVELGAGVTELDAAVKNQGNDPRFTDAFVQKLSKGDVEWIQQIAGDGIEFVSDLRVDSGNHILLAGAWYGTADFGDGPTLTSVKGNDEFDDRNDNDRDFSYDAFLWKIDPINEATVFIKPLGSVQDDFGIGAGVMSDDSILLTGRFDGTVDFDAGPGVLDLTAGGLADVYVTGFAQGGATLF